MMKRLFALLLTLALLTGCAAAETPAETAAEMPAETAAVNRYTGEELGYSTDLPYIPLSDAVYDLWSFPTSFGQPFTMQDIVYSVMSKNKFLKVWVLAGYYDLATPFYAAEWFFDHVFVNEETEENLQFTYYPCGHMIYMQENCLASFRQEAEKWFNR